MGFWGKNIQRKPANDYEDALKILSVAYFMDKLTFPTALQIVHPDMGS